MPLALLKLIPFRDYAYAALAIAAVIFWFHHDHVEQAKGAARVTAAVATATAKANADAQTKIDKLNTEHGKDVAAIEESYERTIQSNDASHAADLQRLRERAASQGNSPGQVLGSTPGGETTLDGGTRSTSGVGSVPAEQALNLADALRADDAALTKCYADRDSLTGK